MKIKNIASTCMLGLVALTMTSCSDNDNIIESLSFSKNFAPLGIEAKSVKETTANIEWKVSQNATSYTMEVYADDSLTYEGTPEQIITGITNDDIPYTVENLQFDTKYSVRIQALTDGNDSRTSTWNGVYFRTGTKQFLKTPKPAQISDRSVTLTWEVEDGFDVSTLKVGDITHELTAEEKEASQATIEGLSPETDYTAYLYYNGKQCGNRNFTTIADLEGAVVIHEDDDIKTAIEGAEEGAVLALYGGTYELNPDDNGEYGAVKINNTITIKGIYPTDQPVIKGRFEINEGAGLTMSQVTINGSENAVKDGKAEQIFNFKTADANYGVLDIQNCEIIGRPEMKGLVYLNVKAIVEAINFNNCIVSGIECNGGDFIDSRLGLPREINLTNSTFYNVATSRDFIRVDDASKNFDGEAGPKVTVDQCTFYNVGGAGANYRLLYVRFAGNKLTFTNNIVVGTTYKRGFTNQSSSDQDPTLNGNFYFNCQNLTSPGKSTDDTIVWFDTDSSEYDKTTDAGTIARGKGNGIELTVSPFTVSDPTATPDFTVDANSAAFAAGAGAPRWLSTAD